MSLRCKLRVLPAATNQMLNKHSIQSPRLTPNTSTKQVQCSFDPSGRCAVPRDTMLILPNARTRIAFNGPKTAGLFAWSS